MFYQYVMAQIGPLNNSVCSRWTVIFSSIEGRIATILFKQFDLENTFAKEKYVCISQSIQVTPWSVKH